MPSMSDRRDNRLSANATTIYTRYLNPALGNVAGNIVPDEIRWGATLDDEMWHIWTYQADLRGVFEYAGLKHEALLGIERIETRNWRERWDTPNATGTAPSTNPNALTRYKFPTAGTGAIPAGGWQPAWTELTDLRRYTTANVYVDQTTTRNAVSFTNVISTKNERWHALLGARYDEGENSALSGASINAIAPSAFPKESATSETLGLLYRPWSAISLYASYSTSFSGVPSGLDIYNRLLDKPEEGESREIGVKSSLLNGKLGIEAALFELDRTNVRRQLSDAEQIELIGTTVSGARYAQDAGEEAKGFEVQLLYSPVRGYLVSATYSNIEVKLAKTENVVRIGGPIVGRGKQSGSIFQKYTIQTGKLKDLYFTNGVIWVDGSRPDSISNTTGLVQNYVPGYTRIDLGVGYPFKFNRQRYTVAATVRNVTDEKYFEGYQSKGSPRALRVSVTARF